MKTKFLIIAALSVSACATSAPQTANTNAAAPIASNTAVVTSPHSPPSQVQSAHGNSQSSATTPPNPSNGGAANPITPGMMTGNATPFDTAKFDADIAAADKNFKAKPTDATAKKALADAYAARAFELTNAAQYRSALGDFRKCLKLDPTNEEAKGMHDQIIQIFQSLNREPPKEGEEPPPLPFKKA